MRNIILIISLIFNLEIIEAGNRWVMDESGKYNLIDSTGNKISDKCYDFAYEYFDSIAVPARNNGFWGAVDIKGNEIVPFIYEMVECETFVPYKEHLLQDISDESYIITGFKKNRYDVYDKKGKLILRKCVCVRNLLRGYLLIYRKRGRLKIYSITEKKGYKISKKLSFYSVSPFDSNGISVVSHILNFNTKQQSYLFGAIDTKGEFVIPCIYKSEEEVMKLVGRTERSFDYLNNK